MGTVKEVASLPQAVAASCDILQEAENFILGQPTIVYVPHHVLTLLETAKVCLTSGEKRNYQAILLNNPNVRICLSPKASHIAAD